VFTTATAVICNNGAFQTTLGMQSEGM